MTRINTNVSSLVAQNTLARSNSSLEQALTRLSTGLRINTGKDDPAGLIASENLRSDITSIKKAIDNTDRANQVIATADSALGQVSSLLNDIRGLVTEAANNGAMSDDQIKANQLQIDSSLKALNRISQTVTFQGRKLLDGSLDFITTPGTNFDKLSGLSIDSANLGTTGAVNVAVNVTAAATKAQVDITNVPAATTATNAFTSVTLTNTAQQATGTLTIASEAVGTLSLSGGVINLKALQGGNAAGAEGDQPTTLAITFGAGAAAATYTAATNTLAVSVTQASGAATVNDVIGAINAGTDFSATVASGGGGTVTAGDEAAAVFTLSGGNDSINLTALAAGNADGVEGNAVANLAITFGAGAAATSYTAATHTLNVSVTQASGTATLTNVIAAINGGTDFTAAIGAANGNATVATGDAATASFSLNGGRDAGSTTLRVASDTAGTSGNNVTVTISESSSIANNSVQASVATGSPDAISVLVHGTVTKNQIIDAINNLSGYSAVATAATGDANYVESTDTPPGVATLSGGVAGSGGLTQDTVFELSGLNGSEVFSLGANTSISDVAKAINLVKDATGVEANVNVNGTTLELTSSAYGSKAFVGIKVINEATGGTIRTAVGDSARDEGADVVATVNGISAKGDGNNIAINTSTLDLKTTLAAGFTGSIAFDITGGGALFQLGPEVVSNQQARIGITSVNTSRLGGASGVLYQLGSGGVADLASDPTAAANIVDEAINQVTSLRGRLGAFQRTSIETNKNALNDTLVNLTEAESKIRDADFASESAALTRAQILVQSGTTVLQVANQNPQNVLSLLR